MPDHRPDVVHCRSVARLRRSWAAPIRMSRLVQKSLEGMEILGFSLAGEETVIGAPEYNVCFDVGRAPREVLSIDNVCLTHGHMDHAAGIAYYFSQRAFVGNAPGRIIVHRALAQPIQRLMDVWADIEGHHSPGTVWGVSHLEDVPIRRGLLVRPFDVNHAASALGFSLIEERNKLKPEYAGLQGPEIVALKKQGVEITERQEITLLTFPGDTALGRFLELDFVCRSQRLLMECTFFDREHVSRARAGRHIHVHDLPQVLSAIPNAQVLLTHLSRRTDLREAKRILAQVIAPSDLDRVGFLMERPARRSNSPSPQSSMP